MRAMLLLGAFAAATAVAGDLAQAHSDGCHSAHSCPSDHHTYVWYDSTGGWSCARPGSDTYDSSRDTTTKSYGGYTYHCYAAGSAPPPSGSSDTDGDGVPDTSDACPTTYALTANGCPPPQPRTYVGRFDFMGYYVLFGLPSAYKPRQVHPFSADDNAWLYGLRWTGWGKASAVGRGKAKANHCRPSCAQGRFVRRRGARVKVYRVRAGDCRGKSARFYTRARLYFPRGLRLRPFTVKLVTGCGRS